jgi:class 3 adenylate cyclase
MFRRLPAYLLAPTPAVRPEGYRAYVLFSIGTISALFLHGCYTVLFWVSGVDEMVWFNLAVSFPAYIVGFLANRRGFHLGVMVLAALELIAHQILAVRYVGWEAGLQYYLLVIPCVAYYLPGGRWRVDGTVKLLMVLLATATFLGLLLWSRELRPVHAISPVLLDAVNYVGIVSIFLLLAFFAYNYSNAAETAERKLREEYARAEGLLHNILPVPIAERLKRGGGTIADGFSDASVLFADIVGFTGLSEKVSPQRLVALLNELFSEFDDLVAERGLEKIKTIGDAYMVASGIPSERPDHAEALVELALEMLAVAHRQGERLRCPFEMRIGINSGPVVAGVIGRRKFIYDLWGDSVNTAARMESHGVAGAVQVSQSTYDKLKGRYDFEPRGSIAIKGKGNMPVYVVRGRASEGGRS